jgi:glycosyltransferase involved in cell wall biosynthesis
MRVQPPIIHQVLVSPLIGGAGVVAIRLASAVHRCGVRSVAWVPGVGPATEALEAAGVSWRPYNLEGMRRSTFSHLRAAGRMLGGLSWRSRPIVHVHNPTVYRLLRPALLPVRARTVVHFQIEPTAEEIRWTMKVPPDCIVTCARYIAASIATELAAVQPAPRIVAVPNSIDVERFTPGNRDEARRRLGMPTPRVVLLMMANLAPHKGQQTALRALQLVTRAGIDAECWMAGEDRDPGRPHEGELRRLADALEIASRVRFLGFRADGPDLLRSADVLLLPSTHEGLPLIVLEAQAAGVPVIGSTIPGVAEVIEDGHTGCLVPAADAGGYALAIERLVRDGELMQRITAAAATQVHQHHSWQAFQRAILDIYGSLSPTAALALSTGGADPTVFASRNGAE